MFNFGDSAAQAQMLRDAVKSLEVKEIELPDYPVDEMTVQELRNANAYAWLVLDQAHEQGYSDEVIAEVEADYKEIFKALCEHDDGFRERVTTGKVNIPVIDPNPYLSYAKGQNSEL